jgi:hypothetical protein
MRLPFRASRRSARQDVPDEVVADGLDAGAVPCRRRVVIAEEAVRGLVAGWLAESPAPAQWARLTGLLAPPAPAAAVIAAARDLILQDVAAGPRAAPPPELRRLVDAMVLDEHPSAQVWSPADRGVAAEWIALVIHRFGEDGIRRLTRTLARG